MVMIERGQYSYTMDGYLKTALDRAIDAVKKDDDLVLTIDGKERQGKSTLAIQIAKYVDPTFELDRICFDPDDFRKKCLEAKQYQAIVFDEAYVFSSRGALTAVNKKINRLLAEIGQANLYIIIVIPSFFELERYAALHRSKALIHVYSKDNKRGKFAFFNWRKKQQLYISGKKFYSYSKPSSNFVGSFGSKLPIDEHDYRQKKRVSLRNAFKEEENPSRKESRARIMFENLVFILWKRNIGIQKDISEMVGENSPQKISQTQISEIIKRKRESEGGL